MQFIFNEEDLLESLTEDLRQSGSTELMTNEPFHCVRVNDSFKKKQERTEKISQSLEIQEKALRKEYPSFDFDNIDYKKYRDDDIMVNDDEVVIQDTNLSQT